MIPQLPAQEIIDTFGELFSTYGYALVAAAAFSENIALLNFIIPGSTVVWIAGFYAQQGLLNPFAVWAVATFAATLGNQVDYALGYTGVYQIIRILKIERQVEKFKKRFVHGGHLIDAFFIYLAGYTRSFLLLALGALKVSWVPYLAFTTTSAAIRKGIFVSVGYFFGTNEPFVVWFFTNFWWVGLALLAFWLIFHEVILKQLLGLLRLLRLLK